jgi:hypothetical protein
MTTEQRFWSKVSKTKNCWVWLASTRHGYGQFSLGGRKGRMEYAHRGSWFLTHGTWPVHFCLHNCDNPLCVRPSHLYDGTHQNNSNDKLDRKRHSHGSSHGRVKLTDKHIIEIRKLGQEGLTQTEIAHRFKIHQVHVSRIISRKTWSHL